MNSPESLKLHLSIAETGKLLALKGKSVVRLVNRVHASGSGDGASAAVMPASFVSLQRGCVCTVWQSFCM